MGDVPLDQAYGVPGPPEMRPDEPADRAGSDDGQLHGPDHRTIPVAGRLPAWEVVRYGRLGR